MGRLLILASAACFGAMAIFGKYAYEEGVTPSQLLLVRFVLAGAVLLCVVALQPRQRAAARRLTRGPVITGLAMGAIIYATQSSFFFAALQRIDATLVSIVFYTYPVLVTVLAIALRRDVLTRERSLALVLASVGVLLVLLGAGSFQIDLFGVAMAFGSAVAYTAYLLIGDHVLEQLPPLLLTVLVMLGASVTFGVNAAVQRVGFDLSARAWFWLAAIAVVSTVLSLTLLFAGLRRTGPSTAAILSTFEPVVTAGLAALVLAEQLTARQWLGAALVLASALVVQQRAEARPRLE
ncbi:MAG: DMT family transporter [Actinomycetia bacterium]|nr:DMT family transporter [Actinomycetes bacterium]